VTAVLRQGIELPLLGGGGEAVDFERTIRSHGVAGLPPMRELEGPSFEVTLTLPGNTVRTTVVEQASRATASITVLGRAPGARTKAAVAQAVRHVLRLDEDLSAFYEMAAADPLLAWVATGAGRMIRSQSVFEDVVKTVCTTNCAWSVTERMVNALVTHLGKAAPTAPSEGPWGRAFPTPQAMASQPEAFYKDVVRAGYRARYFIELATAVAEGTVDLESWGALDASELPDDELAVRLQALPGVGPYAAAHIMTMMGRYSRLILDSWTRPTYARIMGSKRGYADRTIERRFKRYGPYAGLAFWLLLTKGWVEEG
jgi:N-glycosylase/DNA lyase